ncbi:MAG: endonuclease/exonuclease/phosphatase family protein, partial [Pseudomonadota bacterium]
MFHQNSDLEGLAEDIVASNADFVTLQELSQDNGPLLLNLKETYPYQLICRSKKVRGGTAVLSRVKPLENGVCTRDYASARLTVDLGERVGPIHVTSVHLSWPYPREQPRQLRDLLRDLEALDYPVIIGGDFNMVPWSHALSSVAQASGTRRLGPAQATFQLGFVPLSIDHVFAPYRGLVQTRPRLGSDHLGLRAVVNMANPN